MRTVACYILSIVFCIMLRTKPQDALLQEPVHKTPPVSVPQQDSLPQADKGGLGMTAIVVR